MSHHVLLIGGHGKVAQLLTPLLLKRSWTVTSLIRSNEQVATIKSLADSGPGKLNVLVRSVEEVKSDEQAKAILEEVWPDYVVWSAGAGGKSKGPVSRTMAIDRDAATHFIRACAAMPHVARFLMVSYIGARRLAPSWWSADAWAKSVETRSTLGDYYEAKTSADEALVRAAKGRPGWVALCLRPGWLTDDEASGKVELGRTKGSTGTVSRANVARVADEWLAKDGAKTAWLDLLDGDEEVGMAVERVVREGVDVSEGEPVTKET